MAEQESNETQRTETFEETIIETEGGSQQIASMLADLYSPNFKSNLRNWLDSVETYPRPFNMVFVPLTDFLGRFRKVFHLIVAVNTPGISSKRNFYYVSRPPTFTSSYEIRGF